jgi:hypothetical protein
MCEDVREGIKLTGRLEGSTANQETVNVGLLAELLAVLLADTATVQDAGLVSDLVANLLLQPGTDGGVDLLGLLSGGDLAGTNGPDGLVGNDNLAPVADLLLESGKLVGNDLEGLARLALLKRLTAAPDDADTVLNGVLGLGGNNLVRLLEDGTALRVTQDGPVDAGVLELLDGDLASEGTVGLVVDVLGSNLDGLLLQVLTDGQEVKGGRSNDGLYCSRGMV